MNRAPLGGAEKRSRIAQTCQTPWRRRSISPWTKLEEIRSGELSRWVEGFAMLPQCDAVMWTNRGIRDLN